MLIGEILYVGQALGCQEINIGFPINWCIWLCDSAHLSWSPDPEHWPGCPGDLNEVWDLASACQGLQSRWAGGPEEATSWREQEALSVMSPVMAHIASSLGFRGGERGLEAEHVEVLRRSEWAAATPLQRGRQLFLCLIGRVLQVPL